MKIRVFDTEGVGLNSSATKLWNLCYTEDGEDFHYTTDYDTMRGWLQEPDVLWVGHYAIGHCLLYTSPSPRDVHRIPELFVGHFYV